MCYREAAVDFAGIHVACLTGEEGAGKWALLDGITWSVWGISRLGAGRDDDLVRVDSDSVEVAFTFGVGGEVYRVRRRFRPARHSRTMLDFHIRESGSWRRLVEGGLRANQEAINRTLRLDYDTFVSATFLRQGWAEGIMVQTAAERRRILKDSLRLGRWSTYETRVQEYLSTIHAEVEATDVRLKEIEAELARRDDYEAELDAARGMVDEAAEAVEVARDAYRGIETARTELARVDSRIRDRDTEIERARRALEACAEEIGARRILLAQLEQGLGRRRELEDGGRVSATAGESEGELSHRLAQWTALDERRRELQARIAQARSRLEVRRETLMERVEGLERRLPNRALLEEQADHEAQVDHLSQLAASRDAAKEDLARLAESRARLREENAGLRREMEVLKEMMGLLKDAPGYCPLCNQSLPEDHSRPLVEQVEREGKAKGDLFRANQAELVRIAEESLALEEQLAQSEEVLRELPALRRESAALADRVQRGRHAAKELDEVRSELRDVERRLAEGDYGCAERTELDSVWEGLGQLGYDGQAHRDARIAAVEAEAATAENAELDAIPGSVVVERKPLKRLEEAAECWEERLARATQERRRLEDEADGLRRELAGREAVEEKLQAMRGEEAAARHELGAARQRLAACQALQQQRADKLKRKQTLEMEKGIYAELAEAFSFSGVPALMIDAALAEIEAEANRLLAVITDSGLQVSFRAEDQAKAGEPREDLQLQTSDEAGPRLYQDYSEREHFQVAFAIRIALSKMLVRGRGAQLQTLVIDEGVGASDTRGRQWLVEAIKAVEDDFARVLVIPQAAGLETWFPTQIQVTKGADGATVRVL